MITYIEYLGIPGTIATGIVAVFFLMQIVGLILDIKGKAVPMVMNTFGYFKKRKQKELEREATLKEVQESLKKFDAHYSADNIEKRDTWMAWVNNQAGVYTKDIGDLKDEMGKVTKALEDNTLITEEMFIQTSRDRIIDFASKVGSGNTPVSREEYNRIFKVYERYEDFLKQRNLPNGEVAVNYQIILKSYEKHTIEHTFAEDMQN